MKDGRWHLVYTSVSGTGAAGYGSISDIDTHVVAGADFKVSTDKQAIGLPNGTSFIYGVLNEECQQVYRSQSNASVFYCLSAVRFAGEATSEASHGSVRYGSDGSLYCNSYTAGSPGNGCTTKPASIKWYVRY